MDVTPLLSDKAKPVRSYGTGVFNVAGERFNGSVLLGSESVRLFAVSAVADLTADHARELAAAGLRPDILLIGTGRRYAEPSRAFLDALAEAGLPFPELMDTGAACRTHNVLLGEERAVLSLLVAL